jgi:asparagine synthase (glutamine-hydrolysing)
MITNGFLATTDHSILDRAEDIMRYRAWYGYRMGYIGGLALLYCPVNDHGNDDNDILIHGFMRDGVGNYSYLSISDDAITFARDPLGCKPLYYEYSNGISIASDRRVLRRPNTVRQGYRYTYILKSKELVIEEHQRLVYNPSDVSMQDAIENLESILKHVMNIVCTDRIMVGVSGIDSTILTSIALEYTDVKAVTVCVKDSYDYINAEHELLVVDEDDIIDALRRLEEAGMPIGDDNIMHTSIACIVSILAGYAKRSGYGTVILGQLADELFAGYARYIRYHSIYGDGLNEILFNDVMRAESDLIRDDTAASPYTALILPYAFHILAEYAVNLPAYLKINGGIRKFILRKVAERMGIPSRIAYKEKKAMQFSSGIYRMVKNIMHSYKNDKNDKNDNQ